MTEPPAFRGHALAAHDCVDEAASPERKHADFVRQLFERYRKPLLRYLSALLGGRADAEDVLQEAYARLLDVPHLEPTPARARAYLFKTATNLAYDRFRGRGKVVLAEPDDAAPCDAADTPEGIVGFEQGLDTVRRGVRELKPRCRQVFLLRAVEELGYDEIAARLGVSRRTVEREMSRALAALQKRLQRSWK